MRIVFYTWKTFSSLYPTHPHYLSIELAEQNGPLNVTTALISYTIDDVRSINQATYHLLT